MQLGTLRCLSVLRKALCACRKVRTAVPLRLVALGLCLAGASGAMADKALAASYGAYTLEESKAWNAKPAPAHPRDFSGVWWATRYTRDFRQLDGTLPPMT